MCIRVADDRDLNASCAVVMIFLNLIAILLEVGQTAEYLERIEGMCFEHIVGEILGNLIYVADPVRMRENTETVCLFDMIADPYTGSIGEFFHVFGNIQRFRECIDFGFVLIVAHDVGADSRDGAPIGIGTLDDVLLGAFEQTVDTVITAEIDDMDIVSGQVDLFAGVELDVKVQRSVEIAGFQRRIVFSVVGDRHEVVACFAVIGGNDEGVLLAVGAGRMHMHIADIGVSSDEIVSDRVNGKLNQSFVLEKNADVIFAFLIKGMNDMEATVVGGRHGV